MFSRMVTKFNSEKARNWIRYTLCTTCVGSAIVIYAPQTVFIDYYKRLFEMHRNDIPVPVEGDILTKFNEILTDVKTYLPPRAKITPFIAYGFDPINAGYTNTLQGAIVGIPSTFGYKSLKDVDENPILVEGRALKEDIPAAEKLKSSIVLSDCAKKYAICREVLIANTPQLYLQTFYPPALMISLNWFSHFSKVYLGLNNQPPLLRGIYYFMLTMFGFSVWFFLKDNTSLYYENFVENQICALGQNYIQGGLEYYTKRLERNKALRELTTRGPSMYTVTGNENIIFRNKTIPLTVRQYYFQEQLKRKSALSNSEPVNEKIM